MKQGQETNQIWTQEAGTDDTHNITLTGEGGVGALEAPQDKHGQEHRTGTSRAEQTTEAMAELGALEAMAELGALEAMAGGHSWPWPRPSARPLQPETLLPPQKISLGKLGGIRSPPGLETQNSTRQDRKALRGQTDRTGQPTGTGSPPGLARRLRLLLGMTRSQRPSQGPSATASISATRGQVARTWADRTLQSKSSTSSERVQHELIFSSS